MTNPLRWLKLRLHVWRWKRSVARRWREADLVYWETRNRARRAYRDRRVAFGLRMDAAANRMRRDRVRLTRRKPLD